MHNTHWCQVFLGFYAVIQAVLVVLWSLNPSLGSQATVPAACLSFVASLALLALSHTEHLRSIRPSAIINVYLLLTLLFDVVRTRSLWQITGTKTIAACFSSSVSVKSIILFTEAFEKRDILLYPFQNASPEVTSGVYSRSMFWWLNNLMSTGFKRLLSNDDLYPIDDEMRTVTLLANSKHAWNTQNRMRSHALARATMRALRWPIAYCIFPRLCLIAFKYTQPFLIARTITFSDSPHESNNIGWGLTAAYGFVYIGTAISNGAYYHMSYRFVTSIRGSLVTLIYAKTVDLSITALDESVAMTLMATDTETICEGFRNSHELWATPIEVGVAMYLLYRQIGIALLGPGVMAFCATGGIVLIASHVGKAQTAWIEGIQTRVDVTSAMLGVMKAVKMLGFSDILTDIVQNLRLDELELSKKFRKLLCIRIFLANSTALLSPLLSFIIFVALANKNGLTLNTASAFSALSIISLVSGPINTVIRVIPQMNAALACFARIQEFLQSDARRDHRLKLGRSHNDDSSRSPPSTNDGEIELQDLGGLVSPPELLTVRNGTFAWSLDGAPVVRDATFTLRRNTFTFVIGPVGSGKSSLLKALLGEMPSSKGFVYTNAPNAGFVDQTPWIQNGTVRDNILGVSSYEEPWYSTVVRACALDQDINYMPNGHNTQVGSAGISLSGGQKQRIALARGVYARQPFVMLDDVFSGLDAQTEDKIFSRLFGRQGLFRTNHISVLLVTHAVHRLPFSDHVIVLGVDGRISEQGSHEQLLQSGGYVQSLEATAKAESEGDTDDAEPPAQSGQLLQQIEELTGEIAELNRQTGELAIYKYYFSALGWRRVIVYTLLIWVFAASSSLTQLVVTFWTSSIDLKGDRVDAFYLGMYGGMVTVAVCTLTGVAWYVLHYSIHPSVLTTRRYYLVMYATIQYRIIHY